MMGVLSYALRGRFETPHGVQKGYEAFCLAPSPVAGAVAVRIGWCAASLPAPEDLRRTVGIVAHAFSTPPVVWRMELRELADWGALARDLLEIRRR